MLDLFNMICFDLFWHGFFYGNLCINTALEGTWLVENFSKNNKDKHVINVLISLPEQGCSWFSFITHDTLWLLISTPHQHCLHARMSISTRSIFHFKGVCVFQFLEFTPLCYEQQKRFNIHRYSPSELPVL